ncbi:MAG: sugar phosphate isomerase/epimerase [Verrucomicrobia bacterium]|nr:sugar phosphate isomerase/epimerase [Verrucomicrobiota bacterium]
MKFGICNEIFQNWQLADAMAYAKQAGYDCIEIAPFTLLPGASHKYVTAIPADERRTIRETAARVGIEISGIHWVLVQADGLHLTQPDAAIRQRTADYFVALADFCGDLGGKTIVVGSPKQRSLLEGVSHAQAWAWATEVFRPAVARAADRGVTICFEPLAPSETNFINTAAEGIAFARQFSSPAMSVILDVKAMSSEAKPVPQIIRESRGNFAYFHANDANLKGPGFGDVDFKPIAAALRDARYDGVVSVEVFKFEEGPEAIATQSLAYLKKTFAV